MRVIFFLTLLFFGQCAPFVRSFETEPEEMLSIAKVSPIIAGTRCTSRALRSSSPLNSEEIYFDSNNATANDDNNWLETTDGLEILPINSSPYCPDGYFCDLSGNENRNTTDEILGLCKPCAVHSNDCISSFSSTESTSSEEFIFSLEKATVEECEEQCTTRKNVCSSVADCPLGLFCNFQDSELGGYCEACPGHLFFCQIDFNLTSQGLQACESSCAVNCRSQGALEITDSIDLSSLYIDDVNSFHGSPQMSASGPIADCGLGLEPCEDVEGSVCLIERGKTTFLNKTRNCYAGGGIAAVIYNVEAQCKNIEGTYFGGKTYIPAVSLTHLDGRAILEKAKSMPLEAPLYAKVEVGGQGVMPDSNACVLGCSERNECEGTNFICDFDNGDFGDCLAVESEASCNEGANDIAAHIICTDEREFCDFSSGGRGFCRSCPKIDSACFFSDLNSAGTTECNHVCTGDIAQELDSAPCKFCPKGSFAIGDIGDGFESTEKEEVTEPCEFCASTSVSECSSVNRWDMKYPKRTISMFGSNVECWAVAEFYRSLNIEANTKICDSARSFNYICGCSDTPGYAGADSDSRRIALVWFPRIGAILSILGSSLMIINVLIDAQRRKKVVGELIVFLCVFDIIGSISYTFTSYPTPKQDYIYGAEGNGASCAAQGFFIQIGTISLYTNVSISFYYLLMIRFSWREHRLKKSWVYYMFFLAPVSAGAIFAFAGIPFYDNTILWCNNSRKYWSEIPIAVAIFIITVVMVNLCWFVFKSERASRRFRQNEEERSSLSNAFFKQSLVYLSAFYLTWPPYLALQIMIASGYAFTSYRFIVFAGTAVTLQGFWNCVFHIGLNGHMIGKGIKDAWTTVKTQASASIRGFSGKGQVSKQNVSIGVFSDKEERKV